MPFQKGYHPKTEFKKGVYQGFGFKKGQKPINGFKKGMITWNKNRKMNDYPHCGFQKGNSGFRSAESYKKAGEKISQALMGKKLSDNHRKHISEGHKGMKKPWVSEMMHFKTREKNYRWVSDRSKLVKKEERNDSAYHEWRKQVFKRDNWRCRINNRDCDGKITAHHILSWTYYPKSRYNINNGITLCQAHHPRVRAEEKRLIPTFQELVSVSKESI